MFAVDLDEDLILLKYKYLERIANIKGENILRTLSTFRVEKSKEMSRLLYGLIRNMEVFVMTDYGTKINHWLLINIEIRHQIR